METEHFDHLATSLGQSRDRRTALRALGLALLGAGGAALLGQQPTAATKKHKTARGKRRHSREGTVRAQLMISDDDPTVDDDPIIVERSPQQAFVDACRANGGTTSRVSTYKVKCCYTTCPGSQVPCTGWCDTCDFNSSPPSCQVTYLSGTVEFDPNVTPGPASTAP